MQMLPDIPKTIGIVGSRRRNSKEDFLILRNTLFNTGLHRPGDILISGGCTKGADSFAEVIAFEYGIDIKIHLPDKSNLDMDLMKVSPRVAFREINYARNTLIANDSDVLVAMVAPDRKGGTEDTIRKFLKRMPSERLWLI
jgi:hypothetical protein